MTIHEPNKAPLRKKNQLTLHQATKQWAPSQTWSLYVEAVAGWFADITSLPQSPQAPHLDVSSAQVALSLPQWKLPHTYLVEYFLLQPKHMMVSAMSCNVHKAELKPHEIFRVLPNSHTTQCCKNKQTLWNQPHTYIMLCEDEWIHIEGS